MTVPMVDLQQQYAQLEQELLPQVQQLLASGRYVMGEHGRALEQDLAAYCGMPDAVAVASGTDALHLALRALDIGPGDEVITSAFTFAATAEAICYVGATPVFVDIDPQTFNLDPQQVAAAINERTRALLPVHLFGLPAAMPELTELAQQHGLLVVEDAAQAIGADIGGRRCGGWGEAGCFSFFPSKNLGACGDGGLITCGSSDLAERLRRLRNHGSSQRYTHSEIGYNSRLDEIQALILRHKFQYLETYNDKRRTVAQQYQQQLADLPLTLPNEAGAGRHVYHQYTLRLQQRDALQQALQQEQIAAAIYYPVPLHQQPAFAAYAPAAGLPATEEAARQVLSLPMYPELEPAVIERIGGVVRAALEG